MSECHSTASYSSWNDYVIHELKKGKTIGTQDRWTEDQVKYLVVDLWETNISRLESQQSRKVWSEIASKVNEHRAPPKSVRAKN